MKRILLISVFLVVLLLSACVAPITTPEITITPTSAPTVTVTATPAPTLPPTPTPTPTIDLPSLGSDEVCALVYNYLENKAALMTDDTQRIPTLGTLTKGRPYCSANYQGNGKWQVSGIGINGASWPYNGGLWNLYEASRAIEPANEQATALLLYIERWTIPQATTQQEPAVPTPTPPPAPTVTVPGFIGINPNIIESNINGTFTGWDGDTIFQLTNGQIWQQASYSYVYYYAYRPAVIIYLTSGGYKMIVDGVSETIFVRQLK